MSSLEVMGAMESNMWYEHDQHMRINTISNDFQNDGKYHTIHDELFFAALKSLSFSLQHSNAGTNLFL
jgi:hypothetical protein